MKLIKGLLAIALVSLIAVSCKEEAKDKTAEDATTEEVTTDKTAGDADTEVKTEESSSDVPSFDNADVQAYVDSYESYMAEYAKVAESKDMSKMADLGTKGTELATKAQEAMKNLSGDDVTKLTDYMTAKSKELQALTAKLTGQ